MDWASGLFALGGALIGGGATVITVAIQSRSAERRERSKLVL